MVCIGAVATLALFFSPGLGLESQYDVAELRRYHIFVNLFIFAMLLAVSANNVGIMWVAVEATTIFSAMVIPLALTKSFRGGLVEIHPHKLGGYYAGLCRDSACLFRFRCAVRA